MTESEITELKSSGIFPENDKVSEIIETGISWVLIGEKYAYKIKKPVKYSFLNFSTLELRNFYCKEELRLNQRLTEGVYLDVLAVTATNGKFVVGGASGQVIEFLVFMKKLDQSKQMNFLLKSDSVSKDQIRSLCELIQTFHSHSEIIHSEFNVTVLQDEFNDIISVNDFISHAFPAVADKVLDCISLSDHFLLSNTSIFQQRYKEGFVRDCHGDLHAQNIFLYEKPVIFDCIEFNREWRHIDVLKEIAFLCMDLDFYQRNDLSEYFLECYCQQKLNNEQSLIFIYYKFLHANVRTKVYALKAMNDSNQDTKKDDLLQCEKYLNLMLQYGPMLMAN